MAKKIKPNSLFDDSPIAKPIDNDEPEKEMTPEETLAKVIGVDENSIIGAGRISNEDAAKLEQFDAMEKSLAQMSKEKEMLETKVAEYVEKLDGLKDVDSTVIKLNKEKTDLKAKCKELEEKSKNVSKLEKEIKALRDENVHYLIKISELTFENANLTCQLSELEKKFKNSGNVANQGKFGINTGVQHLQNGLAQPNRDAYNPYINNGYGTW